MKQTKHSAAQWLLNETSESGCSVYRTWEFDSYAEAEAAMLRLPPRRYEIREAAEGSEA